MIALSAEDVRLGGHHPALVAGVAEALRRGRVVLAFEEVFSLGLPLRRRAHPLPEPGQVRLFAAAEAQLPQALELPEVGKLRSVVHQQGVAGPGHGHVQQVELVPHVGYPGGIQRLACQDAPPDVGGLALLGELPQKRRVELQPLGLIDRKDQLRAQPLLQPVPLVLAPHQDDTPGPGQADALEHRLLVHAFDQAGRLSLELPALAQLAAAQSHQALLEIEQGVGQGHDAAHAAEVQA